MNYRFFEIDKKEVNLYPLVCWHLGARQSDRSFIHRVIQEIKGDPNAYWLYMGDAGECNIKESKGDIYSQTCSPGDQMEEAISLLSPIKEKGLFGLSGNHGLRIYKATGVDWDRSLCERVGIPYCGTACLFNLRLKHTPQSKDGGGLKTVSLYAHHGSSGSITTGGKVTAGKKPEQFVVADIILTAHSHACGELPCPRHYAQADSRNRKTVWKTTRSFLCGSAYDSRSGYAELKMYPPILPEHLVLNLHQATDKDGYRIVRITSRKITAF